MQPWYLVEPQPISCANEKTTNFYFFWLLSSFFTTILCKNVFRWSSNSIAVVWSPKDLLQVNIFSSWPTLENTFTFSLFLHEQIEPIWNKKLKIFLFSLITICQFPNWFQSFINTIFLQEKSSRWSSFWPFCLFKIYFFEDKVKIGFQSVVK